MISQTHDMHRFVLRLIVFVLIFLISDFGVSYVIRQYRPSDYKLFIEAKQELFERSDTEYDFIVIGDSHISDALDTRIFKNVLNFNGFNLGVYHASPYEWFYLFKASLIRLDKKPKVLLIGTNPDMFTRPHEAGKYTELILDDVYLEYQLYANSKDGLSAPFFIQTLKEKYLFKSILNRVKGKEYIPTRTIRAVSNGYLETINHTDSSGWTNSKEQKRKLQEIQISYFKRLISLAQENQVQVFIINSPIWRERMETKRDSEIFKATQQIVDSIAKEQNVPVFNKDYRILQSNLKQTDFLNSEHLNTYGAAKFTLEVCKWLEDQRLTQAKKP